MKMDDIYYHVQLITRDSPINKSLYYGDSFLDMLKIVTSGDYNLSNAWCNHWSDDSKTVVIDLENRK
jgi:hypothetical protein